MDTLTRVMHDAAADAPTTLAATGEEWVSTSWRSGRRRRAVRGVAAGAGLAAAAALVVSLVVSGVGGMPSASVPADGSSRSAREGVTSYPQRIGHQWRVRDLPATPGPIAGLVQVAEEDGDTYTSSWHAITPSGTRYRLPIGLDLGSFPAVSPDGTRVGFIANGSPSRYEVRDLVDGTMVRYPRVGDARMSDDTDADRSYEVSTQFPSFFSPSGESLAIGAVRPNAEWGGVLVLGADGSTTEVPGLSQAAGWIDDDRLVGRLIAGTSTPAQEARFASGVDLVVWDRRSGRTEPLARVDLPDPGPGLSPDTLGQFWGTVRSDRTLWVSAGVGVADDEIPSDQLWLVGYALPSGAPVAMDGRSVSEPEAIEVDVPQGLVNFQRFWRGTNPLQGTDGDVRVAPLLAPDDAIVVAEGSVGVTQVIWAQDAIDGSPSFSPFGTWSFLPLWWWKEIALVALALAALRWLVVRRRQRRAALADPARR